MPNKYPLYVRCIWVWLSRGPHPKGFCPTVRPMVYWRTDGKDRMIPFNSPGPWGSWIVSAKMSTLISLAELQQVKTCSSSTEAARGRKGCCFVQHVLSSIMDVYVKGLFILWWTFTVIEHVSCVQLCCYFRFANIWSFRIWLPVGIYRYCKRCWWMEIGTCLLYTIHVSSFWLQRCFWNFTPEHNLCFASYFRPERNVGKPLKLILNIDRYARFYNIKVLNRWILPHMVDSVMRFCVNIHLKFWWI